MHDTAPPSESEAMSLVDLTPASSQVTDSLLHLLHQVVVLSEPDGSLQRTSSRHRGRPATLALPHLALALLVGVLHGSKHLTTIWRQLGVENIGTFAPVSVTYEAVRKRLLLHGVTALRQLFEQVTRGMMQLSPHPSACSLAPFASAIVALDESSLDHLHRLTDELHDLPPGDPHLIPGKLACLFDVRRQQMVRVQFRADVLAACNTALLLLLEGLAPGSLILADLGYFSFAWFDYLTGQGYWWVSRLKERVSYDVLEVLAYDDATGLLDALVSLGSYRANRAAYPVRLVCFRLRDTSYRYISNVLSPAQLSTHDLVALYARRWDIEMAFKVLKRELGLHLWWGARPELVLVQLWVALLLAQLLYGVQGYLASAAQVDPSQISMHVLLELSRMTPADSPSLLAFLLQHGRALGLIRPSHRMQVTVPSVCSHTLCPVPPVHPPRHARYAHPKAPPRSAPFVSSFLTQLLI